MINIPINQKASKLLLCLMILSLISIICLRPAVAQEENADTTEDNEVLFADQSVLINQDWLDVSVTSFGGNELDYTGKYNRLNIDHGGHGMTNFINHGEVAVDKETDTHVYMADMVFSTSAVVYTDCMIDDVYPGHYTRTHDEEWLNLKTFKTWFYGYYKDDITHDRYNLVWTGITIPTIDTQEYDGALRLHAKVSPNLPIEEGGTITLKGVKFNVPDIRVLISDVKMVDRSYGVCDDPNNFYTDNQEVIEIRKDDLASSQLEFDKGSSEARQATGDGVDKDWTNTGWKPRELISWLGVADRVRYYGVTYTSTDVGQGYASSPAVGTTWSRSDDQNDLDDEFDCDVHIRLKPNIFYDMETFDIRHAYMYVDRYKESFLPEYGLCDVKDMYTKTKSRIVGLGVQNIFIMMDFEYTVRILLSIQPTGEEGEDILEDPEIYQSDIVWENGFYGTTDVQVPISEGPRTWLDDIGDWFAGIADWFDNLLDDLFGGGWLDALKDWLWLIILIAIIIIVIIVIVIILRVLPKRRYTKEYRRQIKTEKPT